MTARMDGLRARDPYAVVFEQAATGMVLLDAEGRFLRVNPAYCEWLGYTEPELQALGFLALTHPEDVAGQRQLIENICNGVLPSGRLELRCQHKLGNEIWGLLTLSLVHSSDGHPLYFVAQVQDITTLKRTESHLEAQERELAEILAHLPDIITRYSRTFRILYINPAIEATTGLPATHYLGCTLEEAGAPPDYIRERETQLRQVFETGRSTAHDFVYLTPHGPRHLQSQLIPERGGAGQVISVLVITRDVTELRSAQRQHEEVQQQLAAASSELENLVAVDSLTGLPTRRVFDERLKAEYALAENGRQPFCLLFVDIDNFRAFNESYGTQEGDRALRQVGLILKKAVRPTDLVTRYTDEEFAVLFPRTDKAGGHELAVRCHFALSDFLWPRRPITASFGLADWRGQDLEDLQVQADAALFKAKDRGGNCVIHVDELFGSLGD
jgi:diguanylate cyclase (GGDEF)-like protein/PAS domain S-box-containing protein